MENHIEIEETKQDKGFTLVELLIVIVILGILATVTVFAVTGITNKGKTSACQSDLKVIQTAEEAYDANVGNYGTQDELVTAGLMHDTVPELRRHACGWLACNRGPPGRRGRSAQLLPGRRGRHRLRGHDRLIQLIERSWSRVPFGARLLCVLRTGAHRDRTSTCASTSNCSGSRAGGTSSSPPWRSRPGSCRAGAAIGTSSPMPVER